MLPDTCFATLDEGFVIFSDASTVLSTDFGLYTVIEDLSLTESGLRAPRLRSSGNRGSTGWMAPELLIGFVDNEVPQITTATFAPSDAYVWRYVFCSHLTT